MKTCFLSTKFAFKSGILEDTLKVGAGMVRNFHGSIQQQHCEIGSKEEVESGGKALEKMLNLHNCRCSPICLFFPNFVEKKILFAQMTTH